MISSQRASGTRTLLTALAFAALASACGSGGKDAVLGSGGIVAVPGPAPTVTAVAPLTNATAVPVNSKVIAAAFSVPMDATTLTSTSFTLSCAASPVAGTVAYVAATSSATLTLPATTTLAANSLCTATITTAARSASGTPLAANFAWTFTTGAAPDTTPPTVSSTVPLAGATGVAINARISASFSEAMDPSTLTSATVLLACPAGTAIPGSVGYAVNGNVVTLTPTAALPANTTCTATVTTGAKDLAGNALAAAFAWTFTTGAAPDTIAPTVTSTVPLAGAAGVAINTRVTASFSEAMDPLTITTATFTLACPVGSPVAGTVGYAASGSIATFTPTAALTANTTCTATVTTGAKDLAGNALAAPFVWTFTTGAAPDTTAPTVSSTVPLAGATGVAINTRVNASFSEAMDPLTITTATFTLACPAGSPVAGTVGYVTSGSIATFTPTAALPANTTCTATVTTGAKDLAGNSLAAPFVWTFTTGAAPDTTAPTVASTVPLAGATGVAINSRVTASFSEAMDPSTITSGTFLLACPAGTAIAGTTGYAASGNVATFTPTAALPANTTCTATITIGAKDLAGNSLATPFVWTFTTGAAPDTTSPTVTSTGPAAGATGVAINARVTTSFSEPMDPLSITTASFTLACPVGAPVTGTVGYAASGSIATFTPTATLPANTSCTATITTGAKDLAGNALVAPYVWTFTTGAVPDTTAPTVSSTAPLAGATGVAINTRITASFSEPMDPLTITTSTFTLACPVGAPVTGTVGYAASGSIATFTPTATLPATTTCTATITGGARDVAGNALATPFVWSFTTGAAPDTTAPTVTSTLPAAGATVVAINAQVTATFSEAMDPLTITATTFTLSCPAGASVAGTVGYAASGSVATFTPSAGLPANTTCSATITTGAKDLAGNALGAPYVWTFTTGAAPDTTAPTVTSTVPGAGATGVALNAAITASFSEAMDPLSISTATFTLACPAGASVAGTVGYASSGSIATFTPTTALPAATVCTATIGTGARDLAGNALASPYIWTFTTGAAPDITAPKVSSTAPRPGATGVPVNARVSAAFSEPMDPLTINATTFTVACPAPVTGAVAYAVAGNVATFTPSVLLPVNTTCTATLGTGAKDLAGNALAAPFVWTFKSGASADSTPPTVALTTPVAGATGVAINTRVTATFSEPMDPSTITSATVTLACPVGGAIAGTVGYAVNGSMATFTPTGVLPTNTTCTATVTTGARDLDGNALASAFVWTFATGAATDAIAPTVTLTNPANGAVGVCINKAINATFSESMDPLSITTATFTLAQTAGPTVAGLIAYDPRTAIATFTPLGNLIGTPGTSYTATIKGGVGGVADLAGNPLAVDRVWSFTTNASTCAAAPALGAATGFGSFGGNSTLTNDGLATVINGDIGVNAASTTITGLHDAGGNVYTITPNNNGVVNGLVYTQTAPPGSVAGAAVLQARADALVAFNSISPTSLPGGIDVSNLAQCPSCGGAGGGPDELAGRTLPPGIYLSSAGTFDIGGASRTTASLTLDAGGDASAVWVFQTTAGTGTLNVGLTGPSTPAVPIKVLLINGAQSKNVFWYAPAGAAIGTGSTLSGTVLSNATITISTTGGSPPTAVVTTIDGRVIALTAGVTMTNTVINTPPP